jgi:uncharacterized OB-fold protein
VSDLILPDVDDEVAGPFWQACAAGELATQACASCGRRRMPPRPMCPWCRSFAVRWDVMTGSGSVWSFAIPHAPLLPAYADRLPYAALVVTLDDDPSIRLVGDTAAGVDPHALAIGDPVRVVFEQAAADVWLPRWAPHLRR